MTRRLLTQEEYDEIKRTRSFPRAMQALAAYVKQPTGRTATGKALTNTERTRRRRARLKVQASK